MAIIPETLHITIPKKSNSSVSEDGRIADNMSVWFSFQDDNPDTLPIDVYGYSQIPQWGSVYNVNGRILSGYVCRGVHAARNTTNADHVKERRDACWWKVEVLYRLLGSPDGSTEYNERSMSVSAGTITVPTVTRYDFLGNPFVNSAGQLFDPPAQYERRIPTFSITREEYNNPMSKKTSYEGCVNSGGFWGLRKHCVKVISIRPSNTFVTSPTNPSRPSWNVTYEIAVDTTTHGYTKSGEEIYGWQTALLDCGKMEKVDGKLKKILDDGGLEVDDPVRLDGNGQKLESGSDVFLQFMLHPMADLNGLGLPNPFSL